MSATGRRRPAAAPLAALLLLLAACAPQVAPPGTEPGPPALAPDRVITADGLELPLRAWRPEGRPRAVVLALHGFNDYSGAFARPAPALTDRGLAVYAYDQRGFGAAPHAGLWPGTGRLIDDMAAVARLLHRRHPGVPLYLLGDSMGGAVVLAAAGRGALPDVAGVILVAPAVWARETMPFYQRWALWLASHVMPWARMTGEDLGVRPTDNLEVLYELAEDPLVIKKTRVDAVKGLTDLMDEALASAGALEAPALALYGVHDEVVPWPPTLRLWRRLAESGGPETFALYADGWHMLLRDRQAEVVLSDIAAWIGDPGAPLPSGAEEPARRALESGELPAETAARTGPRPALAPAQALHGPEQRPQRHHHDGAEQHVGHRPLHGGDDEAEGVARERAEAAEQRRRLDLEQRQHQADGERGGGQLEDQPGGAADGHARGDSPAAPARSTPVQTGLAAAARRAGARHPGAIPVYRPAALHYGPPTPISTASARP